MSLSCIQRYRIPGDDDEPCPDGQVCEFECDDDDGDGLPDCELKECELDADPDGDDLDDGICVEPPPPSSSCPCNFSVGNFNALAPNFQNSFCIVFDELEGINGIVIGTDTPPPHQRG